MRRIPKQIRRMIKGLNQTLVQLLIGIIIITFIIGALGLIFASSKLWFCLSLFIGAVIACIWAISMTITIETQLELPVEDSVKYARRNYAFRFIFIMLALFIATRIEEIHIVALLVGMLTLKLAVYIRPLTIKLISKIKSIEGR